jgi:hypothetical protein
MTPKIFSPYVFNSRSPPKKTPRYLQTMASISAALSIKTDFINPPTPQRLAAYPRIWMHSDSQLLHFFYCTDVSRSQPYRSLVICPAPWPLPFTKQPFFTAAISLARHPQCYCIVIVRNVIAPQMMPLSARIKLASIHKVLHLIIKPSRDQETTHTSAKLLRMHFHILWNILCQSSSIFANKLHPSKIIYQQVHISCHMIWEHTTINRLQQYH